MKLMKVSNTKFEFLSSCNCQNFSALTYCHTTLNYQLQSITITRTLYKTINIFSIF